MSEPRSATDSIEAENNTIVSVFGMSLEVRAKTSGKALVAILSKENAKVLIEALLFAHGQKNEDTARMDFLHKHGFNAVLQAQFNADMRTWIDNARRMAGEWISSKNGGS